MGWTDPATWSVGELVLASKMNTHIRDNLNATTSVRVVKPSDESVTSSTTLQNDDHLLVAMGVNEVWFADFVLRVIDNSSGAADFKLAFTVPTGATLSLYSTYIAVSGSTVEFQEFTTSGLSTTVGMTNVIRPMRISGIVANGANEGNLQLQWAQAVSNASSVQVKANSILIATKLA